MPVGTCLCGKISFTFPAQIDLKVMCHCADCRKWTGSTYSINLIVPADTFVLDRGIPKSYARKGSSGNAALCWFCGDCGSGLWQEIGGHDTKVIQGGAVDDYSVLDKAEPDFEIFVPNRPSWLPDLQGPEQFASMPGSGKVNGS